MIKLRAVTKTFEGSRIRVPILNNASATLPDGAKIGLLGPNGAGKTTVLRMLAGLVAPDQGSVTVSGKISWPVGFQGSFHPDLSGAENTRFVARLYRKNTKEMTRFVNDFAGLGAHFNKPFRSYSSGMRARLAFAVSVAVPFDTYLIDEITAVGDASFRRKCEDTLTNILQQNGAVIVTHSMEFLRRTCQSGIVLEKGKLRHFDQIEEAIEYHIEAMHRAAKASAAA